MLVCECLDLPNKFIRQSKQQNYFSVSFSRTHTLTHSLPVTVDCIVNLTTESQAVKNQKNHSPRSVMTLLLFSPSVGSRHLLLVPSETMRDLLTYGRAGPASGREGFQPIERKMVSAETSQRGILLRSSSFQVREFARAGKFPRKFGRTEIPRPPHR